MARGCPALAWLAVQCLPSTLDTDKWPKMQTSEAYSVKQGEQKRWTRIEHHQQMHITETLMRGVCECVFWLPSRWQSCMYALVCIVYVSVPGSVSMHMCVCWLPNVESRKRLHGWRGCLFIHYPAASVVSGGHGNTCPGPFSTGLFVACFGPAKASSSHLLSSQLLFIPSVSGFTSFSYNLLS